MRILKTVSYLGIWARGTREYKRNSASKSNVHNSSAPGRISLASFICRVEGMRSDVINI
jgi:hypothetical protein